jgi:hypothetical protein
MRESCLISFLAAILVLLSGCVPYQKIVKTEFPQGEREIKNRKIIGRNLRHDRILDEFSTDIEMDALWFSDEVRELYVDMVSRKEALDDASKNELLTSHLEKNDNELTFYVLVYTPEKHRSDLNDKNPFWSMYLNMPDGQKRHMSSIKEIDIVDLDPVVKELFGHHVTEHKRAFLTTFPVKAFSFNHVSSNDLKMELVFRSTKAWKPLTWNLGQEAKKKNTVEDYYWIEYL